MRWRWVWTQRKRETGKVLPSGGKEATNGEHGEPLRSTRTGGKKAIRCEMLPFHLSSQEGSRRGMAKGKHSRRQLGEKSPKERGKDYWRVVN